MLEEKPWLQALLYLGTSTEHSGVIKVSSKVCRHRLLHLPLHHSQHSHLNAGQLFFLFCSGIGDITLVPNFAQICNVEAEQQALHVDCSSFTLRQNIKARFVKMAQPLFLCPDSIALPAYPPAAELTKSTSSRRRPVSPPWF